MMKRTLLVVLSLSGWSLSTCLLHQYHYVPDSKTWTEAQTYCRQTYTDLATIENTEEQNQLIRTVSAAGYNFEVWIGLYNQINWTWSDGYTGSGAEYRNWNTHNANEPDFYEVREFCVNTGNIAWFDDNCMGNIPFICYSGTQLNPEFVFVDKRMSWSSAQSYCRRNFRDLVTVRNSSEDLQIRSLVPNGYAWIGLFREPNFYWSDQSVFSFSDWVSGENQIDSMNVICGVADLQRSGKWKFLSCDERKPFVCYTSLPEPVKRQVVKLRMKLEDSSVDLNDPVVEADLLKKLQDRLKEKGVSGVTVKWRRQADEKIIHKEGESFQKKNRKKTEL